MLFAANHDSRITNFGALVNQHLINWQKAKVKLNSHFHNIKYHALSLEIASNSIDTLSGQTPPISHQLESIRAQKVHDNKKKLCSIVDCIITCAKQGISFRGHRDDRPDVIENPYSNHGNFLELLSFRARGGDEMLKKHLETAPKNAVYTSKTI